MAVWSALQTVGLDVPQFDAINSTEKNLSIVLPMGYVKSDNVSHVASDNIYSQEKRWKLICTLVNLTICFFAIKMKGDGGSS